MLRLIALIVPLALDTFAVSAAIGLARPPTRVRMTLSLTMAGFELVMPLVGYAAGRVVAGAAGSVLGYVALAVLAGVGVSMLRESERPDIGSADGGPLGAGKLAALGLAVSLDELAIGFSLGLLRLPVLPVIVLIGLQAFAAAQIGQSLGARLGERVAEGAERLAGLALIALAAGLLIERLA